MATEKKSLHAECLMLALNVDSHESDLYIEDTPAARKLVTFHGHEIKSFISPIDGKSWLDVPFAYEPFWEKPPRMMPGQEPYSPAEQAKIDKLIGGAAEAAEAFGEDELEWQARRPPPGAEKWLAACFMRAIEAIRATDAGRDRDSKARAFALVGAIEGAAKLTSEQTGKVNHFLWPDRYDEHGQERKDADPPPNCSICGRPKVRFTAGSITGPWMCITHTREESRDG